MSIESIESTITKSIKTNCQLDPIRFVRLIPTGLFFHCKYTDFELLAKVPRQFPARTHRQDLLWHVAMFADRQRRIYTPSLLRECSTMRPGNVDTTTTTTPTTTTLRRPEGKREIAINHSTLFRLVPWSSLRLLRGTSNCLVLFSLSRYDVNEYCL